MRQPISDTSGYACIKIAFDSGSDATYYKLPSVDGVVAKAPESGARIRCYLGWTPATTTSEVLGILAKFQLLLSGHSCGAISRSGDYQYKGSGGREIDPGLEAGRWSRALAGNSSGSSPYPLSVWQYWVPPLHWVCWPHAWWSGFISFFFFFFFFSKCKSFFIHSRSCASAFLIFFKFILEVLKCSYVHVYSNKDWIFAPFICRYSCALSLPNSKLSNQ